MSASAKIITDSIDGKGNRVTTLQLRYQRFFHSEFMTHRLFSRNASSSRAIPTEKMNNNILNDVAMPTFWGKNKAGMQADSEIQNISTEFDIIKFLNDNASNDEYRVSGNYLNKWNNTSIWKFASKLAVAISSAMANAGFHKQIVNRITEPFQYINVIVTATEWDNFFKLRNHEDAQPEFKELASKMKDALDGSKPVKLGLNHLYHHPYLSHSEFKEIVKTHSIYDALMVSAARCARVSYLNHDGSDCDVEKDIKLAKMLYTAGHLSPFEHQAQILNNHDYKNDSLKELNFLKYRGLTHIDIYGNLWSANFKEFGQLRHFINHIEHD